MEKRDLTSGWDGPRDQQQESDAQTELHGDDVSSKRSRGAADLHLLKNTPGGAGCYNRDIAKKITWRKQIISKRTEQLVVSLSCFVVSTLQGASLLVVYIICYGPLVTIVKLPFS